MACTTWQVLCRRKQSAFAGLSGNSADTIPILARWVRSSQDTPNYRNKYCVPRIDVIIVAAAPDHVPQPLVDQLAPGGKMVIPVGRYYQQLLVIERDKEGNVHRRPNIPVMFVPMTGEAQRRGE